MEYEQHQIEEETEEIETFKELKKENHQQQQEEIITDNNNNSENENSLVNYLVNNRDECQQLISEIIKIDKIDLNTIKEYLNQIDFNDFLKRCTKNKIFKTTITQTASTIVNNKASATELALKNSKKTIKRVDSSGSDYEFIANTECTNSDAALNLNNNLLNQKKSLRLKKKNLLFKKLIEREKDDYYDDSIDEDYEMDDEVPTSTVEQKKKVEKSSSTKIVQSPPVVAHHHHHHKMQKQIETKGMVNVIVNGKTVLIDEKDYKRFVRCGKWCSLEFFRVEMNGMYFCSWGVV